MRFFYLFSLLLYIMNSNISVQMGPKVLVKEYKIYQLNKNYNYILAVIIT